jgi:hypothetical protein
MEKINNKVQLFGRISYFEENAMRNLQLVWKFSIFLVIAGSASLVFLLFLHPMDPASFIRAAFHLSHPISSVAAPGLVAMSAFWIAFGFFALGIAGIFCVFLKQLSRKSVVSTAVSEYDGADKCEENWMFI